MNRRHAVTIVFATFLAAVPVAAQGWRLGIDAGRIHSSMSPVTSPASLAAVAGYEDAVTALRLTVGVPAAGDSVRWGALAAWKRLAVTRGWLTAGIDLSGSVFGFEQRTSAAPDAGGGLIDPLRPPARPVTSTVTGRAIAGQVMPLISLQQGRAQLQLRGGASYHDATTRADLRSRLVPAGEVQVVVTPAANVAVAPVLRHFAPRGEDPATYAGLSLVLASGPARLWSSGGAWSADALAEAERIAWSAGAEVRVASRVALTASARRDGLDPQYRTPAQTSWGLGAAILLGRQSAAQPALMVSRGERGVATIRVSASMFAAPPRVAGDFNGWTPAPMTRTDGNWTYAAPAAPGVYNYAFVDADGNWFVPEGVPGRKDDGFGGHVAVLVVR